MIPGLDFKIRRRPSPVSANIAGESTRAEDIGHWPLARFWSTVTCTCYNLPSKFSSFPQEQKAKDLYVG